jgi:formate dehydrogenase major subunit
MSRFLPYLAELQPELFCEVSPELAAERGLEHAGWATIISARSAIEAKVLVTRRMKPLTVNGGLIHQIGVPWHWGPNGYTKGDAANELAHLSLDPNVHIQEVKALACDIRPGRRPRGPALRELVREYAERAGITGQTGTEV